MLASALPLQKKRSKISSCAKCNMSNLLRRADGRIRCISCGYELESNSVENPIMQRFPAEKRIRRVKTARSSLDSSTGAEGYGGFVGFPPIKQHWDDLGLEDLSLISAPIRAGNIPYASVANIAALLMRDADLRLREFTSALDVLPALDMGGFQSEARYGSSKSSASYRNQLAESDILLRLSLVYLVFCKRKRGRIASIGVGNSRRSLETMELMLGRKVPLGVFVVSAHMCRVVIDFEGGQDNDPFLYLICPSVCSDCGHAVSAVETNGYERVCLNCEDISIELYEA